MLYRMLLSMLLLSFGVSAVGAETARFVALENDQPIGFAILAADAREFTIVNIVGKIDFEDLGKLQGTLGLPDGAMRTATND